MAVGMNNFIRRVVGFHETSFQQIIEYKLTANEKTSKKKKKETPFVIVLLP